MKDSVLKFAVLAVLVIVFAAVAITARWMDDSDYDQISRPSQGSDEVSFETNSSQQQAGTWDTGSKTEFSTVWAARSGSSAEERESQERSTAERRSDWRSNHPSEELDDGGEPPDEREDKDIWRSAVVE